MPGLITGGAGHMNPGIGIMRGLRIAEAVSSSIPATSYANPGGSGDRTTLITPTISGIALDGDINKLVDGLFATGLSFHADTPAAGCTIRFDFLGVSKLITETTFYNGAPADHGVWKWQGSNDGSTWTDLEAGHSLLGSFGGSVDSSLAANIHGYKYYQLLGISGTASASPFLLEMEFKIADYAG